MGAAGEGGRQGEGGSRHDLHSNATTVEFTIQNCNHADW